MHTFDVDTAFSNTFRYILFVFMIDFGSICVYSRKKKQNYDKLTFVLINNNSNKAAFGEKLIESEEEKKRAKEPSKKKQWLKS